MSTEYPGGSRNCHGLALGNVVALRQREKLERGTVKSKSPTCLELCRREGSNTHEEKAHPWEVS